MRKWCLSVFLVFVSCDLEYVAMMGSNKSKPSSQITKKKLSTITLQQMPDWLITPIKWTEDHKSNLLSEDNNVEPTPDLTLDQIITKSTTFPIKFPIESPRSYQLKEKTSTESLVKNINSVYPLIHEYALYLCSIFLEYQRNFGSRKDFYEKMSLTQLVDKILTKRAVTFLDPADRYILISGVTGRENWESIGTDNEKDPLLLENCLSYDELKLSALLSVTSQSHFLNDGDRNNNGIYEEDRGKVEDSGVIVGLIGTRLEKPKVMEYREIMKTKDQNTADYGYANDGKPTLQKEFLKFYGDVIGTYDDIEDQMKASTDRYSNIGGGDYFDVLMYQKRIAISIDTILIEANDRAKQEAKKAYIHVVGLGLGVWKICDEQNRIFVDTFNQRLEVLSPVLNNISDVRFAYIRDSTTGKYKDGDQINGITLHMVNENPQVKLTGVDEGKLLVVSYPWDGNALPGNEFWFGSLSGSGDPAAASSTQVAELHNAHINGKVEAGNLRVATSKGLVTFREYQELHKND